MSAPPVLSESYRISAADDTGLLIYERLKQEAEEICEDMEEGDLEGLRRLKTIADFERGGQGTVWDRGVGAIASVIQHGRVNFLLRILGNSEDESDDEEYEIAALEVLLVSLELPEAVHDLEVRLLFSVVSKYFSLSARHGGVPLCASLLRLAFSHTLSSTLSEDLFLSQLAYSDCLQALPTVAARYPTALGDLAKILGFVVSAETFTPSLIKGFDFKPLLAAAQRVKAETMDTDERVRIRAAIRFM
eukprot:TRINITY_DN27764_c0_g1_i1.p1 TRINITY_DN27764_c0_g1~~TRINITY_DN27764_c0_g1_i1.p1  ORF type:complete len:267 (+),score=31.13 TRINITY_DN27764_c0_g1_i1:61-801(+)